MSTPPNASATEPTADGHGSPPAPQAALLSLVGNTPLVRLARVCPNPKVELWAKVERNNLGGSVKDRIGLAMIERGERLGELEPGKILLEATSGNTGIGLATVAAIKGYRLLLAMSEGVSVERRRILAALGAEFLLTPPELGTDGAIERVYELAAAEPDKYYLTDQYNNPANVEAHYRTTAPEIWAQTAGRITHFVAAMGTTGTVMGCSKRLRELAPQVRIVGVEPYLGHRIQGLKNMKEAYVPGIYDPSALDEKLNVADEAAFEMSRRIARDEGLLVGMSAGAAVHVACELARELEQGVIVTILPDGGERYLSTSLFQVPEQAEEVPTGLSFFNTLTRRSQPFEPLAAGKPVTIYSCGPTVHARPHLGILRRLLCDDLLRRTLALAGYQTRYVVSITDLDDNTIEAAEQQGLALGELCRRHEAEFHEDLRALAIVPADVYARTSECVPQMVELTRELVSKGVAYEKHHSVYFNIGRVADYGELSGKDLGKIRIGATVDLERYDKNDPRDFTLLRRANLAEIRKGQAVKTDWGNVRPSWHVQCSAMARAHLGTEFDIHTASADLIFPHNENELAQAQALGGKSQARFWLHSELVLVGGRKMTYAEGTRVTLPDLLAKGWTAREVRFFLLQTHYRQPVRLGDAGLEAARASLRRIDELVRRLRASQAVVPCVPELDGWLSDARERFRRALYDDLNVATALAALYRLVRQLNHLMDHGRLCPKHAQAALDVLAHMDQVLGVLPPEGEPAADVAPEEIAALVAERERARQSKDFARADELRAQLEARGWSVEDRPEGPRPRRSD